MSLVAREIHVRKYVRGTGMYRNVRYRYQRGLWMGQAILARQSFPRVYGTGDTLYTAYTWKDCAEHPSRIHRQIRN